MELTRAEGEPLGMHIKGGTDNPGNPLRKNDAGIFISKILPSGAIYRCGMLKVMIYEFARICSFELRYSP